VTAVLTCALTLIGCSPETNGYFSASEPCQPKGTRPPFVVATYNIHGGVGRDGMRDLMRTARTLTGADFVGLQEVDRNRWRSRLTNQAKTIADALGHSYWEHVAAENYGPFGVYGNAASTSLPVVKSGSFDLPTADGNPLRRLTWIKFLVDCRPIQAFVIHVTNTGDPSGVTQWAQVRAALSIMARQLGNPPDRHILMGDFNAGPNSLPIVKLREQFVDALSATAAEISNASRTDYIFVSRDYEVVSAREVNDGSSDHPALLATLR